MNKRDQDILELFLGPDYEKDPEVDALLTELDNVYNKLFILAMKKQYGVEASVLDDKHICIDGEVLDDEGFANWIIEHNEKLREEIEEEDEVWGEA